MPEAGAGGGRRVLVADGGPPSALAVARSLAGAGWAVEATRHGPGDRAPRSRGVRPLPAPSPSGDPAGFARAILAAAKAGPRPAVIPATDAALRALEPVREELEAAADYPLPPAEVLRRVLDKDGTLAAARGAGVAVPATVLLRTAAEAGACALRPPLVVKPLSSRWRAADGTVRGAGPSFAADGAGLRAAAEALLGAGCPGALVQEWLPGTGWGVGLLMRGGSPAAVFVHSRLREMHPAGGPSSAAVAEAPDAAVVDPAVALLRALGWEGLAMVEFRREGRGAPLLMEVNGRPWGTLGLAVDAGVDFPRLLLEGHRGPPPPYRIGTRRRWFAGDLRRLLAVHRGRPAGYPGPFPSRARALADVLLSWAPDMVFRWSDPGPFLAEVAGALR
ncbi:MAG: ATP-grasp domain-containing protein [Planctomycetes bacterium]|nr:ATP-grasp domain-containing protein [Planctomycetota bacterium]